VTGSLGTLTLSHYRMGTKAKAPGIDLQRHLQLRQPVLAADVPGIVTRQRSLDVIGVLR
jgi:hypothetical protein